MGWKKWSGIKRRYLMGNAIMEPINSGHAAK